MSTSVSFGASQCGDQDGSDVSGLMQGLKQGTLGRERGSLHHADEKWGAPRRCLLCARSSAPHAAHRKVQ